LDSGPIQANDHLLGSDISNNNLLNGKLAIILEGKLGSAFKFPT